MYLVIGKDDCVWCKKTIEHLSDTREDYAYLNLSEERKETREDLIHMLKHELKITTVPVVLKLIGGYAELIKSYD